MKPILSIFLFTFLFASLLSCTDSSKEKKTAEALDRSPKPALQKPIEKPERPDLNYRISIVKIDSVEFFEVRKKVNPKAEKPEKITDFEKAKKRLRGIVEFYDGEFAQNVKKIHFRNGKVFAPFNMEDCFFVAYFPKEDVLLCEGGHTTDVSFNLKNGLETEDTGNPDLIVSSASKKRRLNSDFEGQECYHYFIQEKFNGEYLKIIELSKAFEDLTNHWLCSVGSAFWSTDDRYLYLSSINYRDEQVIYEYYRIEALK